MKKDRYSAQQLCAMHPNKYIAVTHMRKNTENLIISAEILKVYDDLADCKKRIDEIKFFKSLYKDDFDIIYGDFEEYKLNREEFKEPEISLYDIAEAEFIWKSKYVKQEDYIGKVLKWEEAKAYFPNRWVAFEEPIFRGIGLVRGRLVAVLKDEERLEYELKHLGTGQYIRRTTEVPFMGYIHGELVRIK